MQDCNFDGVYKFPGMIVFDGDVRQWMGTTKKGLDDYIKYATSRGEDLTGYEIYQNGEFIETVKEYMEREMSDE